MALDLNVTCYRWVVLSIAATRLCDIKIMPKCFYMPERHWIAAFVPFRFVTRRKNRRSSTINLNCILTEEAFDICFIDEHSALDWKWQLWFPYGFSFRFLNKMAYSCGYVQFDCSRPFEHGQKVHSVISLPWSGIPKRTAYWTNNCSFKYRRVCNNSHNTGEFSVFVLTVHPWMCLLLIS
jgi:hypothetical protein